MDEIEESIVMMDDSKTENILDDENYGPVNDNSAEDDLSSNSFLHAGNSVVLQFDNDRKFDHTMLGHYTYEINSKSRHKLYTCTKCGARMDGKNRALQHVAGRKPPGVSLKSAKVVHCKNAIEAVKTAILNYWTEKDSMIKENPESFSQQGMSPDAAVPRKRPRKSSTGQNKHSVNYIETVAESHLWQRASRRSPILSRKGYSTLLDCE